MSTLKVRRASARAAPDIEERTVIATWSVRARIFLISGLMVGATMGAAAWFITHAFDAALQARMGQELNIRILELERLFSLDQGKAVMRHRPADPRYNIPESGAYWQISENGKIILKSRSLWTTSLPDDKEITGVFHSDTGPDRTRLFALARKVAFLDPARTGGAQRHFVLEVAEDKRAIAHLQTVFRRNLYGALLLIALVLLVGTILQTLIGLGPLTTLQSRFAAVISGDSDRLRGNFPKEVAPLAEVVNRLLAHQEDQVAKARRRAGTLAHGLKTPLTIISMEAQRHTAAQNAEGDVLEEQVALMRAIVERELARARTHGASAAGGMQTKAHASVERLINLFERMPGAGDLIWTNALPEDLKLAMDPDDFGEVMGNLMDNARKNARRHILIKAHLEPDQVVMEVRNDGYDPSEQGAEATGEQGSGLGLAIIDDVLELYDTKLNLTRQRGNATLAQFSISRRR